MNDKLESRLMLVEYNVKLMEDYLKKFKSYLNDLQAETFEDYLQSRNPDDVMGNLALDIRHSSKIHNNIVSFPQFHYSSFLVTCYSYLEVELNEFCLICEEEFHLDKKVEDLKKHRGITRSEKYLKNTVKIELNQDKWDELKLIAKLRNNIVHLGIDFDKKLLKYENEDLKPYIEKHNLFKEIKYKYLMIDYEFCIHVLNFISPFLFGISNMISKKKDSAF